MKKSLLFILLLSISFFAYTAHASKQGRFLVVSDIHLDATATDKMDISPSGYHSNNDLDQATYEYFIKTLGEEVKSGKLKKPDFIFLLGDIVGHHRATTNNVIQSESIVFRTLSENFPGTPIFYIFGNNDSLLNNYGPFKNTEIINGMQSPADVAKIKAGWSNGFLSTGQYCKKNNKVWPCIENENNDAGYYVAYLAPGLRTIAMNSVLFSKNRKNVSEDAAKQQLIWLDEQLTIASKNHDAVIISMHIPPGHNVYDHSNFWDEEDLSLFLKTTQKFHSTIIGILASHTHAEEWKIIKDKTDHDLVGVYLTASLSTLHGNEPSIKIFDYDHQNNQWALTNYQTYHFTKGQSGIDFKFLYDYQKHYCGYTSKDMKQCFPSLTTEKMIPYFSAGNPNFTGTMTAPNDVYLYVK